MTDKPVIARLAMGFRLTLLGGAGVAVLALGVALVHLFQGGGGDVLLAGLLIGFGLVMIGRMGIGL